MYGTSACVANQQIQLNPVHGMASTDEKADLPVGLNKVLQKKNAGVPSDEFINGLAGALSLCTGSARAKHA
jgi:hypothetical protein